MVLARSIRTVDYRLPRLEHSLLLLTWYRVASPATFDVQLQMGHVDKLRRGMREPKSRVIVL